MDTTEARFLELIRRNGPRLWRIARVYGRRPADAEDLHQEILTQLWRSFPSFRGDSAVDTWVYRVALNTSLAHRRRQQARPEEPMDPAQERYAAAGPGMEERFEARRRLDRLYAAYTWTTSATGRWPRCWGSARRTWGCASTGFASG